MVQNIKAAFAAVRLRDDYGAVLSRPDSISLCRFGSSRLLRQNRRSFPVVQPDGVDTIGRPNYGA